MTDRLWRLAKGEPDTELQALLETDAGLRAEFATLQALSAYRATTDGGLVDAPTALVEQAAGLFSRIRPDLVVRSTPVTEQVAGAVRRFVASLTFDSGTQALSGVRSDTDRQTRQLAFVSDLGDLDLMVTSRDAFSEISGQLGMDEIPAGLQIHFTPVAGNTVLEPVSAPLAANGRFDVALGRGGWLAWVQIGDAILEFPGVDV